MTGRWRRSTAAAALCALALAGLSAAPSAAVQAEYGWWSIAGGPGGIPGAAPGAPTDGLYTAVGPTIPGVTGPVPDPASGQVPAAFSPAAIGALRFPAEPSATATVTLDVTASSTPPQELSGQLPYALLACPISTPDWEPAQNGAFAQHPEFDCQGVASVGDVSDDGKQVSWELSPIFQNPSGSYNVAIVALGQSPYFVSFGAPTASSVVVHSDPSAELSGGDGSAGVDPSATSGDGFGTTAGDTGGTGSSGSGGDLAGFPVAAIPTDTGVPAAGQPGTDVGTTPATGVAQAPVSGGLRRAASVPKPEGSWRILFGSLLVLIGGGLFWMMGQDARMPRLIGPLQGARPVVSPPAVESGSGVRGIGRYARARVGTPRRLR